MSPRETRPTTYADAGVHIDRGNELVDRIRGAVARTARRGSTGNIGGFGGLFDAAALDYKSPLLVAGTDGAGTKVKLAIDADGHDTIGIDLVAMCVNDVLVQGAEPLFFLDYFVCGRLDVDVAERVIAGIAAGCEAAGCSLLGGETAEHPGTYPETEYDLAGFCVGAVERDALIDGSRIRPGDAVIGLASSGPHANGYSLIRKLLAESGTELDHEVDGRSLRELLLEPTSIYVKSVLNLIGQVSVHGIAHITGGGLPENLPRILPGDAAAEIDCGSWTRPGIFHWLHETGNVPVEEMYRTFNCGVGMVVITPPDRAEAAITALKACGESAWVIGKVVPRDGANGPGYLSNNAEF